MNRFPLKEESKDPMQMQSRLQKAHPYADAEGKTVFKCYEYNAGYCKYKADKEVDLGLVRFF